MILPGDSAYPFLRNPAWSPDGRQVAIVRGTGGIAGEIWLVPAARGAPRRLVDEPSPIASDSPTFTPTGAASSIVNPGRREQHLVRAARARASRCALTTGPGSGQLTVDRRGRVDRLHQLALAQHARSAQPRDGAPRAPRHAHPVHLAPAISPDGREIAFTRGEVDGTWHLWIMPFEGGEPRRLTATDAGEVYPRWTPDGRSVLFTTWSAPRRVGTIGVDGAPPVCLAFGAGGDAGYADPSPDGRRVAFSRAEAQAERLDVAPASGGEPTLLAAPRGRRRAGRRTDRSSLSGAIVDTGAAFSSSGLGTPVRGGSPTREAGPSGGRTDARSVTSRSARAATKSFASSRLREARQRFFRSACRARTTPSRSRPTAGPSSFRTACTCPTRFWLLEPRR